MEQVLKQNCTGLENIFRMEQVWKIFSDWNRSGKYFQNRTGLENFMTGTGLENISEWIRSGKYFLNGTGLENISEWNRSGKYFQNRTGL
jgi:hypothetical protein